MLTRLRAFVSREAIALAILAAAISVSAFDYGLDRHVQPTRIREHNEVVRGDGSSPNRYRVLVPFAVESMITVAASVASRDESFRLIYATVYGAGLWLVAAALFGYVRHWFSRDQTMVGVLLIVCTQSIALRYHTFAPWSIVEPLLLTIALTAVRSGQDRWIVPLTVVAALNRETGMLVPLAWLVEGLNSRPRWNRRVQLALVGIAVALAIIVGVRVWRGNVPSALTIADVWRMNTSGQGIKTFIPAITLMLGGAGWVFVALGFRHAPPFVRRSTWLIVCYLPFYLVFGYWYEVRLLMTIYPVLTPLLLSGIYRPHPSHHGETGGVHPSTADNRLTLERSGA